MQFDWWTLTLQAINVLLLAWLLARFFYRPVSAIIAERQAQAQKILSGAEAERSSVEKMQAEIAATQKGVAAERAKVLADATKEADSARAALLKDAQQKAEAIRVENEAHWQRERTAAEGALAELASTLAIEIARRLLDRLPKSVATGLFLDSLLKEIGNLPHNQSALLASATAIEITSASPLDDAQRDRCAAALAAAIGRKPELRFRSDPGLIAGLEIRGPEIVLANSWQSDLDHILKDLHEHGGTFPNA